MAREGFVVYHEWLQWLEPYGDAERGRLLTAMLTYSLTGEAPGLSGNERFMWPAIRDKIDRDKKTYEDTCEKNKRNAEQRYERMRAQPTASEELPNMPTKTKTETGTKTETETEKRETAHARGEYGWVKLTDRQYEKLLKDLGQEELDRCIRYVDESAQKNHNKNKWSDWNLVIRNCHRDGWGLTLQEHAQQKRQYTTAAQYKAPAQKKTAAELQDLIDKI